MKRIVILGSLISTLLYSGPSDKDLKKSLVKSGHPVKLSKSKKGISGDIVFKQKSSRNKSDIIKTAKKYLGVRYRFGGNNRKGIDCSGLTKAVMKKHGKNLPRTARQQASTGKHVNRKNLKAGDLVFFSGTSKHARISHVGIMISSDKFIHASSGKKRVIITNINKPYYKQHYFGARRV